MNAAYHRYEAMKETWREIRKLYARDDFRELGPYPIDWTRIMSPIEMAMWSELSYFNLPFYPQLPVGKFITDFADPDKRIAIECDGAKWHDKEKDRKRDMEMSRDGWFVYRISGANCMRDSLDPWEILEREKAEKDSSEFKAMRDEWLYTTAGGLAYRIACKHYGRNRCWLE